MWAVIRITAPTMQLFLQLKKFRTLEPEKPAVQLTPSYLFTELRLLPYKDLFSLLIRPGWLFLTVLTMSSTEQKGSCRSSSKTNGRLSWHKTISHVECAPVSVPGCSIDVISGIIKWSYCDTASLFCFLKTLHRCVDLVSGTHSSTDKKLWLLPYLTLLLTLEASALSL